MKHQMVLKQFDGTFLVTVELSDGSSERIGTFPNMDRALTEYVMAHKRFLGETLDKRQVMVFEQIKHPQYRMIRIR